VPFEVLNAAPWAVNDPNGYILFPTATPAGTKASADVNAPADSDKVAILYKDGGAGHFDAVAGFTHIMAWQYTDTTGNGKCFIGYQNIAEDFRTAKNNGDQGIGCKLQSDGGGKVDINAFTDGENTKSNGVTGALNELTTYWVKLITTASTFTIEFYNNRADADAGTNMVTSDSINRGGNEPNTYRYFQVMGNENKGSTGREWGFDVWDVDLQEVTGASVENRERFNDGAGTPIPDGTKVYEYDFATKAATGLVATIGGAVVGDGATDTNIPAAATGVGEAVFTRPNGDTAEYYYVLPDISSGTIWATGIAYIVGTRVNPTGVAKLVAEVQSVSGTGTSGATEPVWPVTSGSTVVDNPGPNQITWVMKDAETICTNARVGYQLDHWSAGMTTVIAAAGPPVVAASRVAPAGAGHHAVCTVAGVTGAVEPTWPATIVDGVTTVVDNTTTWTMYNDASYD